MSDRYGVPPRLPSCGQYINNEPANREKIQITKPGCRQFLKDILQCHSKLVAHLEMYRPLNFNQAPDDDNNGSLFQFFFNYKNM